jgi:hypothetical protein
VTSPSTLTSKDEKLSTSKRDTKAGAFLKRRPNVEHGLPSTRRLAAVRKAVQARELAKIALLLARADDEVAARRPSAARSASAKKAAATRKAHGH